MKDNERKAMFAKMGLTKSTLSEKEVKLLQRRINDKKINPGEVPRIRNGNGYNLSKEQSHKGLLWLRDKWKSPTGKERSDNPFGYREEEIIKDPKAKVRLKDFYSERGNWYVPLYEVEGNETSMEYYISGGKINIVG